MKTLENQTLLYDKDCPLCTVYTSGFINTGMLDKNGRKPFSTLTKTEQTYIDIKRATNEIALVDNATKKVTYGIDSLLKVIGYSFPMIEKIGNVKPIHFLLKKLYSFISYNRKVIIPSKNNDSSTLECIPDFNIKYRILYIVFASVVTSIVLFNFSKLIPEIPTSSLSREAIITMGQLLFQTLFIFNLKKETILNYFGNLLTISLFGSLLLLPLLIVNSVFELNIYILLSWFGATVVLMLIEHIKRIKRLDLPRHLTLTWLVYRLIVLLILLNF
ncbi:hypothetical protein [Lacinutrix salivirga]